MASLKNASILQGSASVSVPGGLVGSSFFADGGNTFNYITFFLPSGTYASTILSVYLQGGASPTSLTKLGDTGVVSGSGTGYVKVPLTTPVTITAGQIVWLFLQISSPSGAGAYQPVSFVPNNSLASGSNYCVYADSTIRSTMPNTLTTNAGQNATMIP